MPSSTLPTRERGVRHKPAELGLPLVERRTADAVPPAHICCRGSRLLPLQYPNDLLTAEPAALRSSVLSENGLCQKNGAHSGAYVIPDRPFWWNCSDGSQELPLTRGFCRMTSGYRAAKLYDNLSASHAGNFMLMAPCRLAILERMPLSPEGFDQRAMFRLLESMLDDDNRVFTPCLHTPSLEVGNTSYVEPNPDLINCLGSIKSILNFFFDTTDNALTTPLGSRNMILPDAAPAAELGSN